LFQDKFLNNDDFELDPRGVVRCSAFSASYLKLRRVSSLAAAILITTLMCEASNAGTLFTSILDIETANSGKPLSALQCNIVNVSDKPRSGTISIIGADGTSLSTVAYNNVQPGVGTGNSVGVFSNPAPITLAYCKITVTNAPASSIRGSFTLTDQKGNAAVSVEAR
jgi:hypothetical protein